MKRHLIIMLAALICAGCSDFNIDEVLLNSTEVSVSLKGKVQYTFNPDKGQAAYDRESNLYRYFDDDLGSWFEIRCSTRPATEGEVIKADIDWATKTSFRTEEGMVFTVEKTDETGMIWLWNDSEDIGIIIKEY